MRNLKKAPKVIQKSKCINHIIDYKWNEKIMSGLLDPSEGNDGLDSTLNKIGHKAAIGLTASLLEWIYWRFKEYTTMSDDLYQRIETLWYSVENHEDSKPLLFDPELDIPISGFINGPMWVALMNVRMIDVLYKKGSSMLQSELVGLVLLVRHITPKKKKFDKWLESTLSKLANQFPNQNVQIEFSEDAVYDSSAEPVVCREFFFQSTFTYSNEAAKLALNDFILHIDYEINSFCNNKKKFVNG
ncbi:hypothetical protein D0817_15990 [Flavobacterium cupreum]|uniref:Uncharacterized protein n=1 Tax=Flavobacterium cupreum TaxID=2133766 RepID=A0A434A4T7_9FLAO|nr:hypothetical protein [Flavobacterium cupreum]RUT69345.1 hypothetical protein D0817_15990 [Flavobacterium cupreum]